MSVCAVVGGIVTMNLPGKFLSYYDGSAAGQNQTEEPGDIGLNECIKKGRYTNAGGGYYVRVVIPVNDEKELTPSLRTIRDEILQALRWHAVMGVDANKDDAREGDKDARTEMMACRETAARAEHAMKTLGVEW